MFQFMWFWNNFFIFSESGKFSTSKKIFIPKSHELEHSAEVEIFPLLVENFPLWRNFVFGFWTFTFPKFEPKDAKWKFFHFGGKFSTFKKLQKKKIYSKITWIGSFCIEKFFPKNRKIFHFFQTLENSENLFIRAYNWTKFQQQLFSPKMGIQVGGFWAKFSSFQARNRDFF